MKSPKSLPFNQTNATTLPELIKEFNNLVNVLDEMLRLKTSEIEQIESRLSDGGL